MIFKLALVLTVHDSTDKKEFKIFSFFFCKKKQP